MGAGRLDHLCHRDFGIPDLCILVNEAEEGMGFSVGFGDLVCVCWLPAELSGKDQTNRFGI